MKDDKENLPKELFDDTPLEPTRVFDNLYCIGSKSVVSWLLKTSKGIVIFDSMWDNNDGKLIIDGMNKLGLNPKEIKYILVTHGHGDHYGGAEYIKSQCNAKIIMSSVDKEFMKNVNTGANGPRSPKCTVDIEIDDKKTIELGDNEIVIIKTPGHTPGCLSLVFSGEKNGRRYNIGLWGGTGFPEDLYWKKEYKKSVEFFSKYLREHNVTSLITAHLFDDNGYSKLRAARENNELNPFVIGEKGVSEYFDNLYNAIEDAIIKQSR